MEDRKPIRFKTLAEWKREIKSDRGRFNMECWLTYKAAVFAFKDWWESHAKNHP